MPDEREPRLTWADLFATLLLAATIVLLVAWLGKLPIEPLPSDLKLLLRQGWGWIATAAGGLVIAFLFKRPITVWHALASFVLAVAMGAAVVYLAPLQQHGGSDPTVLMQRIRETRIEFFYTGDADRPFGGKRLGCHQDDKGPRLVCGGGATPIVSERYLSQGGGGCGFNYYAVACAPNR